MTETKGIGFHESMEFMGMRITPFGKGTNGDIYISITVDKDSPRVVLEFLENRFPNLFNRELDGTIVPIARNFNLSVPESQLKPYEAGGTLETKVRKKSRRGTK